MKISFEVFAEVLKALKEQHELRNKYIDSIPRDLVDHVFDNTYANSLAVTNDMLCYVVFEEYTTDVLWFIEECKPGFNTIGFPDRGDTEVKKYEINSIEDYLEYAKKEFIFSET